MTWMDRLGLFGLLDLAGLVLLFGGWIAIGWRIEAKGRWRPSVSILMAEYRRDWMRMMVTRQTRMFDAQVLSTLRQGASFFASATMIAIGGGFALIGNAERLQGVASDLIMTSDPIFVWEVKLLVILVFLANAFLKFVWSHRLFGYCAILIAAVPNDADDPYAQPRATKAAEVNIAAARSFNRGLRSVYFALGSAAWILGAEAFIAATAMTLGVLWRREFASQSRAVLIAGTDGTRHTQT
ncbi:MAG: hypothetical protein B7X55_05225 [Rhodobacterales bacterium 34-62-10]|nr:MAG: hypothetical protein B7X55_05225 [Rhodobacterales bacterium 34-62-10]